VRNEQQNPHKVLGCWTGVNGNYRKLTRQLADGDRRHGDTAVANPAWCNVSSRNKPCTPRLSSPANRGENRTPHHLRWRSPWQVKRSALCALSLLWWFSSDTACPNPSPTLTNSTMICCTFFTSAHKPRCPYQTLIRRYIPKIRRGTTQPKQAPLAMLQTSDPAPSSTVPHPRYPASTSAR